MTTAYRAGIIGTGGVAGLGTIGVHEANSRPLASHAGGYERVDGVELVAAADVDAGRLDTFCDTWDVPNRYTDHESMLADVDLDMVSVCTPALYHHDHVLDVVDAGVDLVLCEKPIASSLAEAARMVAACEAADATLVVNYTLRFTEKFQRLRECIRAEDELGTVYSVAVQSRMELLRNASHVVDLLCYLFDAEVDTVWGHVTGANESVEALSADVDVDDAAGRAMLSLGDVHATVDCTVPRAASSINYRFLGSGGSLSIDLDAGEWQYRKLVDGDHVTAAMTGIDGAWTWDKDYEQGFVNAIAHAVDRLDGSDDTISTGRDATASLAPLVGIYVSHHTGSRLSLPLARPFEDVRIRSW